MLEAFSQLLPERSMSDALAGRVQIVLGGQSYVLPVLSIEANEQFARSLSEPLSQRIADIPDDEPGRAVEALASEGPRAMLDLLYAYDQTGVLPPREELVRVVRPHEVLISLLEVWVAANPLLVAAVAGKQRPPTPTPASPTHTSSQRPNGAGRPASYGATSQTSSSSSFSTLPDDDTPDSPTQPSSPRPKPSGSGPSQRTTPKQPAAGKRG